MVQTPSKDTQSPSSLYQGKRALMLLRVSTPQQEEQYGWPSQEKEIREKLLEQLGLKLDEAKHIIRDTYTGLEFRERLALTVRVNVDAFQRF